MTLLEAAKVLRDELASKPVKDIGIRTAQAWLNLSQVIRKAENEVPIENSQAA